MGNDYRTCRRFRAHGRPPPNPSWGTITLGDHALGEAFEPLLTPHGERLHTGRGPCSRRRSAPNPSWGTITPEVLPDEAHLGGLLTPHGERLREGRAAHPTVRAAPNPSWGTITCSECSARHRGRRPPNPSWGTITRRGGRSRRRIVRLLTPHGERLRNRRLCWPRSARLLTPHGERLRSECSARHCGRRPPNPSWGTITSQLLSPLSACSFLLTPHGERLHSVVLASLPMSRNS